MVKTIRPYQENDIDAIVELSLLAWEPVFASFRNILGEKIYRIIYPDWRKSQADTVTKFCQEMDKHDTLVAEVDGEVVGFLSYSLNQDGKHGEIDLLAVHPDYQNDGIGTALNLAALDAMRSAGMRLAEVATGGDDSHAPARRAYEKAGFTALPLVRYYQELS